MSIHIYWHKKKTTTTRKKVVTTNKKGKKTTKSTKLKVVKVTSTETVYDIADFVTQIQWSGSSTQASRQLSITVTNDPLVKDESCPVLGAGDVISFYNGKTRHFYGRITQSERIGEVGTVQYTAHDYLNLMLKNKVTHKYKKKTVNAIAKDAIKRAGLKPGKLPSTSYKIKKMYVQDTPAYNIMMHAYAKLAAEKKVQYFPYMDGPRVCVKEKGQVVGRKKSGGKVSETYLLSQDRQIYQSKYTKDITDVVNRVDIYNSKGKKVGTVQNDSSVKKYGRRQETLTGSTKNAKKRAKKKLKGIKKELSLEAIGDYRCIAGAGIKIRDTVAGITGYFWIESDTHTFENGIHKMSLTLALKNKTEDPGVTKLTEQKKKTTSSGSSYSGSGGVRKVLNGRKVPAEFTAYCASSGAHTANGEVANYRRKTCAAPKNIKFGTKIQIVDIDGRPSMKGDVYRVNDRGGAIVVRNGRYIFDILMKDEATCRQFGRRRGHVIIGNGTGYHRTGGGGGSAKASGSWMNPLRGHHYYITGRYLEHRSYENHPGIDMACPSGTPIRAANSGRVVIAGRYGGYGYAVMINHGGGLYSLYGHQPAGGIRVRRGQTVRKGQIIGHVDSTGWSTGPHLHFEMRKNGHTVNPANYVRI